MHESLRSRSIVPFHWLFLSRNPEHGSAVLRAIHPRSAEYMRACKKPEFSYAIEEPRNKFLSVAISSHGAQDSWRIRRCQSEGGRYAVAKLKTSLMKTIIIAALTLGLWISGMAGDEKPPSQVSSIPVAWSGKVTDAAQLPV